MVISIINYIFYYIYMNEILTIRTSPIHGLGVFSQKCIKKDTQLVEYFGEEMTWRKFTNKYGKYKYNSQYCYPMKRINKILVAKEEPYRTKNIVNYINEGESLNVILKKRALYTLTDIGEGEELLLRYPKDYDRTW
jgi:SET domain-containing protein